MTASALPARTAADVALGTLTSEPGGFGAALGRLGFGEGTRRPDSYGGYCWTFDAGDVARVISYTDDGDRAVIVAWDQARPSARLEAWRMEFSGSTPQSVVLAAIANALGQLAVTATATAVADKGLRDAAVDWAIDQLGDAGYRADEPGVGAAQTALTRAALLCPSLMGDI